MWADDGDVVPLLIQGRKGAEGNTEILFVELGSRRLEG